MTVEPEEATQVAEATRYFIDRTWFEENNLSFDDLLRERMCEACLARSGEVIEERFTAFDKKSGRMSFEMRAMPYGHNPMKVVREDCSKKKGFITPDMPTLEAIFRIYLANGNQPMPLEHVREQLAEWCPGGGCQWLLLPSETLDRLVEHDRYYGLRRHTVEAS
jgi:hypothetical protein